MGYTLEKAFEKAREYSKGPTAQVTIVTNQENGLVGYATGGLLFQPFSNKGKVPVISFERFYTSAKKELRCLISNRVTKVGPAPPKGGKDLREEQPFALTLPDKWGLVLTSEPIMQAEFTLVSQGNKKFQVPLIEVGNIMMGVGPALGSGARRAVYLIAITDISGPVK